MKFRKKNAVIEAIRYFDVFAVKHLERLPLWFRDAAAGPNMYIGLSITTPNGRVNPGDWIVHGESGEIYPCSNDIFEATYEPVRDKEKIPAELARLLLAWRDTHGMWNAEMIKYIDANFSNLKEVACSDSSAASSAGSEVTDGAPPTPSTSSPTKTSSTGPTTEIPKYPAGASVAAPAAERPEVWAAKLVGKTKPEGYVHIRFSDVGGDSGCELSRQFPEDGWREDFGVDVSCLATSASLRLPAASTPRSTAQ